MYVLFSVYFCLNLFIDKLMELIKNSLKFRNSYIIFKLQTNNVKQTVKQLVKPRQWNDIKWKWVEGLASKMSVSDMPNFLSGGQVTDCQSEVQTRDAKRTRVGRLDDLYIGYSPPVRCWPPFQPCTRRLRKLSVCLSVHTFYNIIIVCKWETPKDEF